MAGKFFLCLALLATLLVGLPGAPPGPVAEATVYVHEPYTFCVLGCPHVGWAFGGISPRNWYQLAAFVDSMNTAGVSFGIICGDWAMDITYPGSQDSLFAITGRASFPWYWTLGNHEALAADTTAGGNPYATSIAAVPQFQGKNWGYEDVANLRLIYVQNNADVDTTAATDYRVNNPFYGGWIPAVDWDGITDPDSPQNAMIDEALSTLEGRIPVLIGHRPTFGSDANAAIRRSLLSVARGDGYVHRTELALPPGRRASAFFADQHLVILTEALFDSAVAGPNERGLYHVQMASGSGIRQIDTTDTFQAGTAWLQAYVGLVEGDLTASRARTSVGIEDTLTFEGDPDIQTRWFGLTVTVAGDQWVRRVWRIPTVNSAAADWYQGAGHLQLVDERTWTMDVRDRR